MKFQSIIALFFVILALSDCRLKKRRLKRRQYVEIANEHADILSPDFDIVDFAQKVGKKNVLGAIAYKVLKKEGLFDLGRDGINEANIGAFLSEATDLYNSDEYPAFYHSALHAADFVQTLYIWLNYGKVIDQYELDNDDKIVLYLGAIGHDLRHPGYANGFQSDLVNRKEDNVKNYYYKILEKMHAHELINLIKRHKIINEGKSIRIFRLLRKYIEDTDFSRHKAHIAILEKLAKPEERGEVSKEDALSCLFHGCDISNFGKKFKLAYTWGKRVTMEFVLEYEVAKKNGFDMKPYDVAMKTPNSALAKRQLGWGQFMAIPYFKLLEGAFKGLKGDDIRLVATSNENMEKFKDLKEGKLEGYKDIDDQDLLKICYEKRDAFNGEEPLGISEPFKI